LSSTGFDVEQIASTNRSEMLLVEEERP